jgi:hypothetical protein
MIKNFWTGLLIGAAGMYWYLTQADTLRATLWDIWERASAAPPIPTRRP